MRQSVRRWLFSAGAVAAVGAMAAGQAGMAGAAQASPAGRATVGNPAASATTATSGAYVPPNHPLYFGESGPAVKSVQQRLAQLKYYVGPIDGEYGQDTIEAAWAFREVQGLPMNETTGSEPIDSAFEHDLISPRAPKVLVPKGPANRIEVNQNDEVLVLYKNDKPEIILHVSTGGGYYFCSQGSCSTAITPDGNFTAASFSSGWVTVPLGTMYNPIWLSIPGYAIHGDIPVPWYPASHGCIRIWMDAAAWFYKYVSIGGAHPEHVYIRGVAPYQPSIVG
jgi:peptidoglycan hydrolase-like protein with peptidoglycan-binding domain